MRLYSPHWLGNLTPKFPKLSRGSPLFSSLEVWGEWKEKKGGRQRNEEREAVSEETRKWRGKKRRARGEKTGEVRGVTDAPCPRQKHLRPS